MMAFHLSFPLIFLLLFSFSREFASLAQTQCLPDQRNALLQLKHGFSTSKLQSWNSTLDCCTWEGVTCNPATGRVIALELSNRSISGRLDPALFNLSSLQNLSLAYNQFYNITLPETGFEQLSNLIHLNLSNSGFIGQIPIGISQLTNLVLLDLSIFYLDAVESNSLYLREPSIKTLLHNLTKLQVLYLDGVNISSNGSEWGMAISHLGPTLRMVSMSGCSLMGPFDQSLSKLSQISYLRLDANNLNSLVPEFFANFSYLSVLKLRSCLINGKFPNGVLQLNYLKVIDLSGNPMLSGHLPDFVKDSSLQMLILSDTNFSGQIPDSISKLRNLSTFLIYNCSFHGEIPTTFQNLSRLSYLDISWNRFTGEIPKFHNWPRISAYVLHNNNFTGSIPNGSYSSLVDLSTVDLRNNSISGIIPISLFSLPSLQILLLSQNQFSGNLPEFSKGSPVLQTVDISSNNLEGPLPRSIFKLSRLNVLNIASNRFTGSLDLGHLWYLKNLTSVDLSNNMLSVTDNVIDNQSRYTSFPNISTLKLVSCNLTRFPSFIRYQTEISTLDLSNNKIGGTIPNWVQNIGNQTFLALNLSHNHFTGLEVDALFLYLDTLAILDLHSNMLNGSVPLPPPSIIFLDMSDNAFSVLPPNFAYNLGFTLYLSLSNNRLTGSIPDSICNASYLQVLDLSYNNFAGVVPNCLLENTSTLAVLNLKNNKLTGSLPQAINEECEFRTVNLNGNNIQGTLPRSLMNCTSLEVLDLGNNEIYDMFPYWLGELSKLRVLVLRSNKFYGPLSELGSQLGTTGSAFPMLQILDLSSNSFNGTLSNDCFKTLSSMIVNSKTGTSLAVGFKYLDFSYYQNSVTVTFRGLEVTLVNTLAIFTSLDLSANSFQGEIPQEIGELKMLVLLNMSHNTFTGTIPPQIGNLQQLESLDLSSNKLTGSIPEELTSLTFLSSLDLSHNNLVGKIPQSQQFLTFANSSYLYNPGLCGNPLTLPCGVPLPEFPISAAKYSINLNEQFIFTGLGFGAGLAVVLGPLMVWKIWRKQFYKCVDCFLGTVLPLWICNSCINKRVGSDDEDDEPAKLVEDDEDEETPKFCLFCTKLDFIGEQVIIHHVECSCHV